MNIGSSETELLSDTPCTELAEPKFDNDRPGGIGTRIRILPSVLLDLKLFQALLIQLSFECGFELLVAHANSVSDV
jgi:hypothetical protein